MVILRVLSAIGQNGGNFRGIPQLIGGEWKGRKQGSTMSSKEKEGKERKRRITEVESTIILKLPL